MNARIKALEKRLDDLQSGTSFSGSTEESKLENNDNDDNNALAENIDTLTRIIEGTTTAFQFASILFKK